LSVVGVGLRTVLTYCQPDHRVTKMLILLQMSASSFTDLQFMKTQTFSSYVRSAKLGLHRRCLYIHNWLSIATVVHFTSLCL